VGFVVVRAWPPLACPNGELVGPCAAPCLVTQREIPTWNCIHTKKSPTFAAHSITDFDISIPADNPENWQDGSRCRSPGWYEICLLSEFPGEGYD
jgi:hypothetical protein